VLSLDSVTGSPLSESEWSLLKSQTSNCPTKFGAIIFIPCLLGLLPPTTATVFHHGPANEPRATRVLALSSSNSKTPQGISHPNFTTADGSCIHTLPGLGPVPVDLSPPPLDDYYTTRAVVAVAAKQVRRVGQVLQGDGFREMHQVFANIVARFECKASIFRQ
jgi:hypothetical protein